MAWVGPVISGLFSLGSSASSKKQGKKAANKLDQQQQLMYDLILGTADEDGNREGGLLGDFTGGMESAIGGLQDRIGLGVGELNRLAGQLEGINPQYDFQRHQFSDGPQIGGFDFASGPQIGGYDFDAGGGFKFSSGGPALQGMSFGRVDTGQSYDFRRGQDLMDQTMEAFRTEEAGVRANALDQMAAQSRADMGGLDAALAARGVGRGSGVASGALADLAGQQGAQQAALNRDLATLGSQTALQAAQFDVNRQLQEDQMQSSYNLGERQMSTQAQLQQMATQAQHNLGMNQLRSQNWLGDQQMRSQHWLADQQMRSGYSLAQDQLASQNWATDQQMRSNYSLAQDQLASQNWLADQQMRSQYDLGFQDMASRYGLSQAELQQRGLGMAGDLISTGMGHDTQASLGIGNLYAGLVPSLLNSLLGMQEMGQRNVTAAGQGAGAGLAGLGSSVQDLISLLTKQENKG